MNKPTALALVAFSYLRWPFEWLHLKSKGGHYTLKQDVRFYSPSCGKWVTARMGFLHDHFSWSPNLPWCWAGVLHDWVFVYGVWDDGTAVTFAESVMLMRDVLMAKPWLRLTVKKYVLGVRSNTARGMWDDYRETDVERRLQYKLLTGAPVDLRTLIDVSPAVASPSLSSSEGHPVVPCPSLSTPHKGPDGR